MATYLAFRSHVKRQKIRQNRFEKSEAELIYECRLLRAAMLKLGDVLKKDLQPSIAVGKSSICTAVHFGDRSAFVFSMFSRLLINKLILELINKLIQ